MTESIDHLKTITNQQEETVSTTETNPCCIGERAYTIHQKHCAERIQKCFRRFLTFKSSLKTNEYGFKKYTTSKNVTYYFCGQSKLPYLVSPQYRAPVLYGGTEKYLSRQSDRFVLLRPATDSKAESFTEHSADKLYHLAVQLADCRFIYPQLVVDKKIMLSRNGGESLLDGFISQGYTVKLSQFKGVCGDLARVHQKDLVIRDVNSLNFVVKTGEHPVRMIDLDRVVRKTELPHQRRLYVTKKYSTRKLLNAQSAHDFELVKRGDQYGLLVVMCESTSRELAREVDQHEGLKEGIVNDTNREKFKKWAEKYAHPEYVDDILAFLQSPEENALPVPLHLMLNWDA